MKTETDLDPEVVEALWQFCVHTCAGEDRKALDAWSHVVAGTPPDRRKLLALATIHRGILPPPDAYDEHGNPARSARTMARFWGLSIEETIDFFNEMAEGMGEPMREAPLHHVH